MPQTHVLNLKPTKKENLMSTKNKRHKAMILAGTASAAISLLTGCNSTSTITEYDLATGKPTKVTITSESVIDQVTKSTKDKTCYVWTKGWGGKLNVASCTTDNPIPGFDAELFNLDKGALTIHKDQANMDKLADVIKACNATALQVSAEGIGGSTGSAADATKSTVKANSESKSAEAK